MFSSSTKVALAGRGDASDCAASDLLAALQVVDQKDCISAYLPREVNEIQKFGMHEQRNLVELRTSHNTTWIFVADTAENRAFKVDRVVKASSS